MIVDSWHGLLFQMMVFNDRHVTIIINKAVIIITSIYLV